MASLGVLTGCWLRCGRLPEGHPQGVPLPIGFSRRWVCPEKGTHKGCPYRLASLGVWPWEGHPQGVPLPIGFSRRLALGRAPTRGAPTDWGLSAVGGRGAPTDWPLGFFLGVPTHKGCPYRIGFSRRLALGRAPTRGAPTDWLARRLGPGAGTHKGRPYRLSSLGVCGGEGPHKGGCPYRLASLGVLTWEGHPQGVPLPIGAFGACRRAPTRGAPTDCLLSAFGKNQGAPTDWEEGHPQGVPLPIGFSRRLDGWEGHPQGVPLPIVFSRRFGPGKGTHKGCPYRLSSLGVLPWEGHPQGVPLPIVFSRRFALRRDEFSVPAVRFVKSGQLQVIIFVLILLHGRPASARQFGRTLSANATCQRRKICKARHGAQS